MVIKADHIDILGRNFATPRFSQYHAHTTLNQIDACTCHTVN